MLADTASTTYEFQLLGKPAMYLRKIVYNEAQEC